MTLDKLRAKGAGRMKEMALVAAGTLLALALIFGILVSTLLTLVVIPVLYFSAFRKEHQA